MDRLTKVCMVLVVALLAVIALRPVFVPANVQAAKYKDYKQFQCPEGNLFQMEGKLAEFSKDGYELVAVTSVDHAAGGVTGPSVLFILGR